MTAITEIEHEGISSAVIILGIKCGIQGTRVRPVSLILPGYCQLMGIVFLFEGTFVLAYDKQAYSCLYIS